MKPLPTKAELHEQFTYDESEGRLYWKKHPSIRHQKFNGTRAGSRHCEGGWTVSGYLHCRLVWAFHHEDPGELEIDHIDGDRSNDRLSNLRVATRQQNQWNVLAKKSGVNLYRNGKYRATIQHKHLGYFDSEAEAITAYETECKKRYGEFSKLKKEPGLDG